MDQKGRLMRLALKYGLPVTIVVILWVVIARFIFPLDPKSSANFVAPVIFNLAEILAIYFGIKAGASVAGQGTLRTSIMTGLSIALVYALSSCLFFALLYLIVGPKLFLSEPMAQNRPVWQIALLAYAGMFFGALILGLIYSLIISLLLRRSLKSH